MAALRYAVRRIAAAKGTDMPPEIDWDAIRGEALDIFVRYLQIDTSNPPGNEAPAARFLGALMEAEGIECEYIETAPGREVVYARIPGDGSKGALMLCNHTDVVPVEAEYWDYPAFEGVIEDGHVYGRGAVDMKGAGVMQLITFLLAKRLELPLKRDLIFCAVPDEETGGSMGMGWLYDHRPELLEVEYEINEGGGGSAEFAGQETKLFGVATNEKQICWLRITAVGTPGHGSVPHKDNSALRLMRALIRLAEWDRGITYTPESRAYVERLAEAGLLPGSDEASVRAAIEESPQMGATFQNTLNVTILDSGIKANVIPAKSEAVIDCRLLPGQSSDEWKQIISDFIDDPAISVEYESGPEERDAPVAVEWDTELYQTIGNVIHDAMEDAVVVPSMTVGGTDNRFLRQRGIPAYGFIPCLLSKEEQAGFHANNEFLTIENLNMGCELMYEIVRRMCV
jgi:acetylornithine deacetylase/succinyl-diaminopimelate desuccinylase-like protein